MGEVVRFVSLFVERCGPEGATGEVVQFGFYSSKEAELKVMAICLMKDDFKIMLIVMDTYLNFRSVGKGPKIVPPR